MRNRVFVVGLLAAYGWACLASAQERLPIPFLSYHFDEKSGEKIIDATGNGHDGVIVGGVIRVKGLRNSAIALNGRNRIQVPSSESLNPDNKVSVSAWIKGKGSPLRFVAGYPEVRSPHFQVAGDRIHLATSGDFLPDSVRSFSGSEHWGEVWPLYTGSGDIDLSHWSYTKRTENPMSGIEPKLQVVDGEIHYEFFGQNADKVWQVYTARSTLEGSQWAAEQRSREVSGYRVEQDSNIQVVNGRVYFGFPRRGSDGVWQLVAASHRTDGSDYREVQLTSGSDGGWIPAIQVWGGRVYYLFTTSPSSVEDGIGLGPAKYDLYFASANLDGSDWKLIRKIAEGRWSLGAWGGFQINDGVVHLVYSQTVDKQLGWSALFTARMSLGGDDFKAERRSSETGFVGPPLNPMQVVGDRAHYVYLMVETSRSAAQKYGDEQRLGNLAALDSGQYVCSYWTAEAKLDGSQWRAIRRESGDCGTALIGGYKAIQVVGGKQYLSATRVDYSSGFKRMREYLGTAGANIVSKGDAFGIGLTEGGELRGFINAGSDYLFRAEAPGNVAGATVDTPVDGRWHHVVVTYDQKNLVLYVDGEFKASTEYFAPMARNPFPLLVGDGFEGFIDDVSIYETILDATQVREIYRTARDD